MEAAPALVTVAPPIVSASPTVPMYADSIDSSPRSRQTDSWEAEPVPPQPPQKLRLMCSYGGHIVPRPHDKNLCYVGGDTRIIVIDRHTSLSDLHNRLSKTLLHNQSFTLKYQLPNEDLDSLISVTTDEDLENMVEEYDRLNNVGGGSKPGRLRFFLFPKSPGNIDQLLVESGSVKSDEWFFNALNGKASNLTGGASDRGFSESSSINNLLGLDEDPVGKGKIGGKDGDSQNDGSKMAANLTGNSAFSHDVHSIPDSPILETTSSFGSTCSSPSLANLPPIKMHVEENPRVGAVGIEDQFQQMNVAVPVGGNANLTLTQKPEELEDFVVPAPAVVTGTVATGLPVLPMVTGDEYTYRVISDDERSDHGGHRIVQAVQLQGQAILSQQPVTQIQQKQAGVTDLASPDSVSSEGSAINPLSKQTQAVYQDPIVQMQSGNSRGTPNHADTKNVEPNAMNFEVQPQVQEPGYILSGQFDHNHPQLHHPQQFVHAGNQYIPAGAVPITSYYPVYHPSLQQHQHQHQHQPRLDQQYPFYFVSSRPSQPYNIQQQQPTYSELAPSVTASRPQVPPNAGLTAHHMGYTPSMGGPGPSSKPELGTAVYRTAAGAGPQLVQLPPGQHPTQYVGYSQIHHPSQSVNPTQYEFGDPAQAQMYYTQPLQPQLATHYQTLTPSPAVVIPNNSAQIPTESMKQQGRTLQP